MKSDGITNAARALACAALVGACGLAEAGAQVRGVQPQQPPPPRPEGRSRSSAMSVELPGPVPETPVPFVDGRAPSGLQTLSFVTPDTNFDRALVKGSPFSAEALTEHVQRLGDGNRLVRRSAARLFRDSAGRTRREHTLAARGGAAAAALAPDGQEPRLIVINDPVARAEYLVDTLRGTLRKRGLPPGLAEARARATAGAEPSYGVLMPTGAAHRRMAQGADAPPPPAPKKEQLGTQEVGGVSAEGTRVTLTIPAGEFDNEQPMEITHETWYSPELRMVVLLKHNDPRFGETVFRLTNVTREEPAPELFAEPQGYRPADDPEFMRGRPMIRRPQP